MSSPAFNEKIFNKLESNADYADAGAMTVSGTINKTGILFLLMLSTSIVSWNIANSDLGMMLMMIAIILNLILGFVIIFKKNLAPTLAPVYALVEGFALGAISARYESVRPGIAMNAMISTFSCLGIMILLYHLKVLQATPRFQKGLAVAMIAIVATYLVNIVMGLFGRPIAMINEGGTIGIVFSLVVVGVATLNFIMDFALIEEGEARKAPKFMEWYSAFAVLLTLIWLYLEILRLLSKLSKK